MTSTVKYHPSSYRDPSGFVFEKEGTIYRQVNSTFQSHFTHFIESGCYKVLTDKGLLIPHEQIDQNLTGSPGYFTTLKPEPVSLITYPYEWSFDMLKDAALLTLRLMQECLALNTILKDASPYNIQWHKGKLVFIDSLSFEKYEEKPWVAYRQFCESFLGPLLLMHYSKKHLHPLQLAWPDGIPLDIIQSLLPKRSRFSLHTWLHIHLHNKVSQKEASSSKNRAVPAFSRQKLLNLVSSLETLINKLHVPPAQSTWSNYYEEAAQRNDYLEQKKNIINKWMDSLPSVRTVADLGANEGTFSQLLTARDIQVVATDFDPYCINSLYSTIKKNKETRIQPLVADLSNPSPPIGVNNEERSSFITRIHTDLTLALALIHHLAIGKNIPLDKIADFFSSFSKYLIIEWVQPEDEKVKLMLSQKRIDCPHYSSTEFEHSFKRYFSMEKKEAIGSSRVLYLMTKKP